MKTALMGIGLALGMANAMVFASGSRMPLVPVRVGGEAELDACGATGTVVVPRKRAAVGAALRDGPGPGFKPLAQVRDGARVWICESRNGWLGVVHAAEGRDCGVSSPVAKRRQYRGPCASGWISRRLVRDEAG